jgi:hypothetical protein
MHTPGRKMTNDPKTFAAEWQRLATSHGDKRIREIASRLYLEPVVHSYFPYASHSDLRLSRNSSYPWDDQGLPFITSCSDDDTRYEARDGTFRPRAGGNLEAAVRTLLELLREVPA